MGPRRGQAGTRDRAAGDSGRKATGPLRGADASWEGLAHSRPLAGWHMGERMSVWSPQRAMPTRKPGFRLARHTWGPVLGSLGNTLVDIGHGRLESRWVSGRREWDRRESPDPILEGLAGGIQEI